MALANGDWVRGSTFAKGDLVVTCFDRYRGPSTRSHSARVKALEGRTGMVVEVLPTADMHVVKFALPRGPVVHAFPLRYIRHAPADIPNDDRPSRMVLLAGDMVCISGRCLDRPRIHPNSDSKIEAYIGQLIACDPQADIYAVRLGRRVVHLPRRYLSVPDYLQADNEAARAAAKVALTVKAAGPLATAQGIARSPVVPVAPTKKAVPAPRSPIWLPVIPEAVYVAEATEAEKRWEAERKSLEARGDRGLGGLGFPRPPVVLGDSDDDSDDDVCDDDDPTASPGLPPAAAEEALAVVATAGSLPMATSILSMAPPPVPPFPPSRSCTLSVQTPAPPALPPLVRGRVVPPLRPRLRCGMAPAEARLLTRRRRRLRQSWVTVEAIAEVAVLVRPLLAAPPALQAVFEAPATLQRSWVAAAAAAVGVAAVAAAVVVRPFSAAPAAPRPARRRSSPRQ